ncbi:MAG: hypothetical protein ACPH9Z_05700, partial [Luminiphilus sp.]
NVVTLTTEAVAQNVASSRNVQATDRALVLLLLPGSALPVPALTNSLILALCALGVWWLGRQRY